MNTFDNGQVRLDILRRRAFNYRWATLPEDVIPLTAADPDFPVAEAIREAIVTYVSEGNLCYGPAQGLPEFRDACAAFIETERSIPSHPDLILASDAAASAMRLVSRFALQPGQEAIIFDPVDFLFRASVEAAGGVPIAYSMDNEENSFDADRLAELVNENTRMICLCNPHNPLGQVATPRMLEAIGEIAVRHNLWIMSDEVWSDIVYPPNRHHSIASISPEIAARTFSIYGFSKSYGIAGLRVGFISAPDTDTMKALTALSRASDTMWGASTVSQIAAVAALTRAGDWLRAFLQHLQGLRDLAVTRLNSMPGVYCDSPQATFVLFPDVSSFGIRSEDIAKHLLETARVAVVPGSSEFFGPGAEGHIRLAFPTSEKILNEGLDRIQMGLSHL
ncbi:MAG: pyridoxal phosphate-dependent aminotransferase [Gammaproteobacteria bacterium]